MRSEVQVLLDPPSPGLPQTIRGLSSVGRAPALQAGCQRFESVRLHHYTSIRFDRKAFGFPVQSDAASSEAFTSFREIISVVGCTRVWVQQGQSFGIGSNDNVVQVKYTNQMNGSCMGIVQKVLSEWKGREKYMLLTGSDPCATQKDTGLTDLGLSSSGSNQAR